MSGPVHVHAADLHGLSRLAVDGVLGTTSLVEQMHYAIARVSGPTLRSKDGRTRGITGLVYRSIHGITGLVGATTDLAFRQIVPRLAQAESTPQRDRALAVINGVLGDHLEATANPLALRMSLRYRGRPLVASTQALDEQLPPARSKIALFLHGLCMSEHHWTPEPAEADQADLPLLASKQAGFLPLHLVYNSGRPIERNGRELADQLDALSRAWPGAIDELALIGHSMGGLIARSACHHAHLSGHAWTASTRRLITLGSPHHGAPLERIGHQVDRALALTPFTAPFTRLGKIRSAGITDLRHGQSVDTAAGYPGLRGLRLYAMGATLAERPEALKSRTLGDGLVTVHSALGRHPDPARVLPLHRQRVLTRTSHLQLLSHPEAGRQLLDWLGDD